MANISFNKLEIRSIGRAGAAALWIQLNSLRLGPLQRKRSQLAVTCFRRDGSESLSGGETGCRSADEARKVRFGSRLHWEGVSFPGRIRKLTPRMKV
jgi:hypothetical protein